MAVFIFLLQLSIWLQSNFNGFTVHLFCICASRSVGGEEEEEEEEEEEAEEEEEEEEEEERMRREEEEEEGGGGEGEGAVVE